jgi:hypothetical protein
MPVKKPDIKYATFFGWTPCTENDETRRNCYKENMK